MADDNSATNNSGDLTFQQLVETDIVDLMGFKNLPEDRRADLMKQIEKTLDTRVADQLYDLLSEEDRSLYSELIKKQDGENAQKFLTEKKIDMEKLYGAEALKLKLELYEETKKVRQKSQSVFEEESQKSNKD